MSKVTIFPNIKTVTNGVDVELSAIISGIKDGKWSQEVNEYRATKNKELKSNCPNFTGSGTFTKRSAKDIIQHSGYIIMDFDHVDPEKLKSLISNDKFISYAFTSIGGEGLAVVVKIDGQKHVQSFFALAKYFKNRYDIEADQACKDVSRTRFISFDNDLLENQHAEIFELSNDEKRDGTCLDILSYMIKNAVQGEKHNMLLKASRLAGGFISGECCIEQDAYTVLVNEVSKKDITDLTGAKKTIADGIEYGKKDPITKDQLTKLKHDIEAEMAAYKKCYSHALSLCEMGKEWNDQDVKYMSESFYMHKTTCEKILKTTYQNNTDSFGVINKPVIARVEAYLNREYDIKRNIVLQSIEIKKKQSCEYERVNVDSIWRELQHKKISFGKESIKSILLSDFVQNYNPILDYFNSLEWDGIERIKDFSNYIKTDNQQFFATMFEKALLRNIACALDGYVNRYIMVFSGEKQNTGKTWFLRFLNPFGQRYYTESPLRDNKDTQFRFSECFIYNLEELSSLNAMEVNKLKAIISQSMVKERKPYAVDEVEQPRRCSFWASTNRDDFLTDTENTRWLVFRVFKIDWNYSKNYNVADIWAEAYHKYRRGDIFNLTGEENELQSKRNREFELVTNEKEIIIKLFSIGTELDQFITNYEIMAVLSEYTERRIVLNNYNVGRAMVQLGYVKATKKINGVSQRGYYVRRNQVNAIGELIPEATHEAF